MRGGGHAVDFWGLGYDIVEHIGLIEEINRIGYHVRQMRIVDDAGRRLVGFGTRVFSELTEGRHVTLQPSDLSRVLFEKVRDRTKNIFGDEIIELEEERNGVGVELRPVRSGISEPMA